MPVKHHRPRDLPVGSRPALCDICGVSWWNYKLTRKADGLLYCPDDVKGADSVTLSEANARDSAYTQRRDSARQNEGSVDTSAFERRVTPEGALGTNLSGWWGYRELRLGSGVIEATNFPHFLEKLPGNLLQNNIPSRPAFDGDNDITFDGVDDFLLSTSRPFVETGKFPSLWVVGNFDDPTSATLDTMVTLSDVGTFMTYSAAAPNRIFLQVQSSTVTAGFSTGAGDVTTSYTFDSTALHLWQLQLLSDRIVLFEDGTQVAEQLSAGLSSLPFSYMFMGAGVTGTTKGQLTTITGHGGRCNEMVLSFDSVTAANVTDLETYFGRNFTELSLS